MIYKLWNILDLSDFSPCIPVSCHLVHSEGVVPNEQKLKCHSAKRPPSFVVLLMVLRKQIITRSIHEVTLISPYHLQGLYKK